MDICYHHCQFIKSFYPKHFESAMQIHSDWRHKSIFSVREFIIFLKVKSLCAVCSFKATGFFYCAKFNLLFFFFSLLSSSPGKAWESTLHVVLCRIVRNVVQWKHVMLWITLLKCFIFFKRKTFGIFVTHTVNATYDI